MLHRLGPSHWSSRSGVVTRVFSNEKSISVSDIFIFGFIFEFIAIRIYYT